MNRLSFIPVLVAGSIGAGLLFASQAHHPANQTTITSDPSQEVADKVARLFDNEPENWDSGVGTVFNDKHHVTVSTGISLRDVDPRDVRVEIDGVDMPGFNDGSKATPEQITVAKAYQNWRIVTRDGKKFHEEVAQHQKMDWFLNKDQER